MYSAASEDAASHSDGSSESKSSLDVPQSSSRSHPHHHHHHHHQHHPNATSTTTTSHEHSQKQNNHQQSLENRHIRSNDSHHVFALGPAIAALRKKRKKFSASRASTPTITSGNASTIDCTSTTNNPPPIIQTVSAAHAIGALTTKGQLQRASSVPTRAADLTSQTIPPRRHEATQSQQPSLDTNEISSITERLGKYFIFLHASNSTFTLFSVSIEENLTLQR